MNEMNNMNASIKHEDYVEPILEVVNLSDAPILADSTRGCGSYGSVCYRWDD